MGQSSSKKVYYCGLLVDKQCLCVFDSMQPIIDVKVPSHLIAPFLDDHEDRYMYEVKIIDGVATSIKRL